MEMKNCKCELCNAEKKYPYIKYKGKFICTECAREMRMLIWRYETFVERNPSQIQNITVFQ